MRILFTGVTSFTGMWFVSALAQASHDVVAVVRGQEGSYDGLRAQRLAVVSPLARIVYGVPFGGEEFLAAAGKLGPFDLFCHHASETANYRSADFDAVGAATKNAAGIVPLLRALAKDGCRRLLLTGSVFEANEGAGSSPMRSFSPYGLSKTLTYETLAYYADREGFGFGKFTIPNPFGPYEEPRFTDYLLKCWTSGEAAGVNTPVYVRDNIPISLLAHGYVRFAETLPAEGFRRINPGFYVESQGAFALRYAREIGGRLKLNCPLNFAEQTEFPEPRIRINTDLLPVAEFGWSESASWDQLADYYAERFKIGTRA
jgi:UDP-glucose 4-epimerase